MNYVWGLILSYVLVFLVIGIATFLQKKGILGEEGARKFIHIGVSNWWILAMIFFKGEHAVWFAIIAPITFIILNYVSYRMNLLKAMERGGKGNLGTVYFPISLLILVIFSFGILNRPEFGAFGILILGYGDGFAAVIGKKYGQKKLIFGKSLEGTLTMFVASFIVSAILLVVTFNISGWIWLALCISLAATLIELLTPKGLDNLSVPLGTSVILYILLFAMQLV
jgi:phytol kinase